MFNFHRLRKKIFFLYFLSFVIKKYVSLHSKSVGLVAQLDRVPDYGSGGCGFDSRPVHLKPVTSRLFSYLDIIQKKISYASILSTKTFK